MQWRKGSVRNWSAMASGPRSWQGWLATAILLVIVIGSRFVKPESFGLPGWSRLALIGVVVTAYLLLVCFTYKDDE